LAQRAVGYKLFSVLRFTAQGVRLDQALAHEARTSRAKAQEWIEMGLVLVEGKPVTKASYRLKGEWVEVEPPPERPPTVGPEAVPLEILYEDADMVVVNKPAGMITHPAPGVTSGTLVNALLGRYAELRGVLEAQIGGDAAPKPESLRPGIVHRLDKDTSGVILVARHEAAHRRLSEAFRGRSVYKRYLALSVGHPKEGTLAAPIGRHPVDRTRMHVGGSPPATPRPTSRSWRPRVNTPWSAPSCTPGAPTRSGSTSKPCTPPSWATRCMENPPP